MFGRKSHGDVKKSATKVLDQKKDTVTRLKHLRVVLETYDVEDARLFFDQHYSYIYYIFHDHFTTVEADLRQRASKQHREELDFVLYVLEKILTLLPELIHKRWQYHSIGRIMKKLLHPGNSIKVQREGMRLFLIWYQILMDNATDECHTTYRSLVPGLGSAEGLGADVFTAPRHITASKVAPLDTSAILTPLSGEEAPDNLTRTLLRFLLKYMVEEVKKIQWSSPEMHIFSFNFLFNKFKDFYLRNVFPEFKDASIYVKATELPEKRLWHPATEASRPPSLAACQEAVVEWFTNMVSTKKVKPSASPPEPPDKPSEDSVDRSLPASDAHPLPVSGSSEAQPGSNASTLSMGSSATEHDSTGSDTGDERDSTEHEIVRQVLYSSRENVNILHEVFRQAFQFPFNEGSTDAIKRVIHINQEWFKVIEDGNRPVFMQEPSVGGPAGSSPSLLHTDSSLNGTDSFTKLPGVSLTPGGPPSDPSSPPDVRAGLQRVIQTFITNAANVFLMDIIPVPGRDADHGVQLTAQVGICKKVINAYRFVIQNHFMDQKTWEQMLLVLLKITSGVLSVTPPKYRENTLGGKLAHPLLQTLIVTWIKANIHVHVSSQLWDQFFKVLSSLTGWAELIQEWAKHMETLTRVLARHVYDLDLNDLPLDRLSEQKAKRQRGRRPQAKDDPRKRTFTRCLSKNDPVEILRAQMRHRGDLDPPRGVGGHHLGVGGHHLGVSESAPAVRGIQPGLSCDDSDPRLTRHRSLSGDASPLSMSQSHLLTSDAMPSPGAMVRSSSDTSLMIDMEKTGSSDLLAEDNRRSLTEEVLSQIVSKVWPKGCDLEETDSLGASFTSAQGELAHFVSPRRDQPRESVTSTYYSATEDVDELSDPDDEIFDKINLTLEKSPNKPTPEKPQVSEKQPLESDSEASRSESTANRDKTSLLNNNNDSKQGATAKFFLPEVSVDLASDEDDEITPSNTRKHSVASSRDSSRHSRDRSLLNPSGSSHDLGERSSLASTLPDNVSLTSGDSSVPYQIIDTTTTDSASVSLDRASVRSDTEVLIRLNAPTSSRHSSLEPATSKSATNGHHQNGHHRDNSYTGSAGSGCADVSSGALGDAEDDDDVTDSVLLRGGRPQGRVKDSPTPDRESIHIEEVTSQREGGIVPPSSEEDHTSVIMGGPLPGWTPVSAVVLWRRMLGCLGDVNKISDPQIHAQVYEYLCDLANLMVKMRDNQGVTRDNQQSPLPPEYLPPVLLFSGWLYEALNLPKEYKRGTLLAYRLLCTTLVRRHDVELSMEQLARFYRILHHGLASQDQDVINVLVRHCCPQFFSVSLRGATALLLDFVQAADLVSASSDTKEAPRPEAISLLGSLVCYPGHDRPTPTLQPHCRDVTVLQCSDLKDRVITVLLRAGKKEPAGLARCIALSSLGIFIYQELSQGTNHPKVKDAIYVLLATLRVSDVSVAQVASDTLHLLCDHVPTLLKSHPQLPQKVIQEIAKALYILLLPMDNSSPEKSKRLLVWTMFCLLEWCVRVPLSVLLEKDHNGSCLIHLVFKVLHIVLCGPQGFSTQQHRNLHSEFNSPPDDGSASPPGGSSPNLAPRSSKSVLELLPDYTPRGQHRLYGSDAALAENSRLKLAAQTVLSHLVNHLGHFPMGGGAATLNTAVQEHHDLLELGVSELGPDIFNMPNVQFFVLNNTTLITLVEIPALTNLPGGGVTAGLTTARTQTRAIIRDTAGKACWDSSVLYGPPRCRQGSYPADPQITLTVPSDLDLIGQSSPSSPVAMDTDSQSEDSLVAYDDLPRFDQDTDGVDSLHQMLQYIGQSSPECLLHPGDALHHTFPRPDQISLGVESVTMERIVFQSQGEEEYYEQHQGDSSMLSQPLLPMDNIDYSSPFHLCRLFLNQLGYLQWEKRTHFDLLQKSEKLLRDLKHLDTQRCRETHKIAVIYVARGQEDKQSVLTNTGGSQAYEDFIAGLGWEVSLDSHAGFMGGLQANQSTGSSAPYYATSTQEVIYHVATRMPADDEQHRNRKLRHLGNDEVQIVWSEHTRDYRRGIIPTEFGDVLIVIYPLHNGLFRIQINRKPEVPYIGPLFDGAIVGAQILPGLVRATALNAGRVLRLQKPYYQAFYEERARYVEELVQVHKEPTMFEDFASQVFSPVQPHGDPLGSQVSLSEPLSVQTSQFYSSLGSDTDSLHSRGSHDKVSPHTAKAKGEGSAFQRRLSFGKSKKSVTKQMQMQLQQMSGQGLPGLHLAPDSPTAQHNKGKK